jgi:hypothetical protein
LLDKGQIEGFCHVVPLALEPIDKWGIKGDCFGRFRKGVRKGCRGNLGGNLKGTFVLDIRDICGVT